MSKNSSDEITARLRRTCGYCGKDKHALPCAPTYARLDPDGTAKPKTKLIAKVNPAHCVPHGGMGVMATHYQDDTGKRTALDADPVFEGFEAFGDWTP